LLHAITASTGRLTTAALAALLIVGLLPMAALAAPPSGSPTLTSPTEGQVVSANPVLSWSAVSGAVKYRVQVSTSPAFSTFAYNQDTVNIKATPLTDLPLGTLYWRVAATDGGSGIGTFTDATFVKQWGVAPTIVAPGLSDVISFPTEPVLFRWNPLVGAKSYTLEIDDANDFIGATTFTTNNTSYTLTEPQTIGQTFFWRLRATSTTGGVVSAWTPTREYVYEWTTVPTQIAPADAVGTPIRDVTFSWQPVVGAKTYQLQVSPNGDWENNPTIDVTVKGTKYTKPVNLDNGSYYWRVRAKDARNPQNNGGWSTEWQFTRNWPLPQIPTLLTPAWNESTPSVVPVVDPPTLSWTPVPLASYYELIVGPDPNFPDDTYSICYTNRTQMTPYQRSAGPVGGEPGLCGFDPSPGALNYWKVRAIDATGGILGLWSADDAASTWRFIYQSALPALLTPADNASVQTPTLTWGAVDNIEKYVVTIKKSNGVTLDQVTTYATSYTPVQLLNGVDGPFSWYVTTIDGLGNHSVVPSSGSWSHFSLDPVVGGATITIASPGDGTSSVRMPKMTWSPVTSAVSYKVFYGPQSGNFFVTPLSGEAGLEYAGFTFKDLPLTSGTYKYYIEAYDSTDVLLDQSAVQTFVISAPLTLGLSDYNQPPRCTLIATCTTLSDTPTITWDPVPGAGAYEITIANDANFTNEIKRYKSVYTTLSPRESFLDQQAGQAIFWFVKPCVDYNLTRCGPNAQTNANDNASAFRKNSAAVEPQTPAAAAVVANLITFNWRDYLATNTDLSPAVDQEAKTYKIEVSTAADFATIFDTATVDQFTYTPFTKTYPEGPLYWRVQAIDASNNALTKSPGRLVTKSSPALTTTFPANAQSVSGVPYFQWTPQAYAATYTIEVYENGDTLFSPANKVLNQTTKFSAWAPTTSLASGTYAWRVRRADADNLAGPWSAARTFTLAAAAPALVSPANAAIVASNRVLLTWGGSQGAVTYKVEVAATCAFSSLLYNATTVMTSWAGTTIFPNDSFCWRVKALDAAGNVIATSSTRTFTVGTAPVPPPAATTYVPIAAVRVLDTRVNNGLAGKFTSSTARSVSVAGRLGIPNDAVAITGNLTVVGQNDSGYLSITPTPNNSPSTSTLNFPTKDIRANNVTSSLAGDGKVSIVYKASAGKTTHVVLDVTGYFLANNAGATYKTVTPVRLLDTRSANGLSGKFTANVSRTWPIAGRGGVPAGAIAVTGNLTVVNQTKSGFVALGPIATNAPQTSTLNFPVGDVRANGVTVKLAANGSLSAVYAAAAGARTHLILDVTGYYVQDLTGAKFYPLATPGRALDSRTAVGLSGKFNANSARTLIVGGRVNVPTNAIAITGNLTVVNQTKAGYASMTKATTSSPTTSTLNFPLSDTRANGVTGPLNGLNVGLAYMAKAGGKTDLVLDVTGYFR
jgi:hypothetical protein